VLTTKIRTQPKWRPCKATGPGLMSFFKTFQTITSKFRTQALLKQIGQK